MKMHTSTVAPAGSAFLPVAAQPQLLDEQQLDETTGGIIPLVAIGLAAFAIGYDIGRDLAQR